ncbi:MAG: phosphoribosylglycinamide formyltransferase [Sphingobacteriaceae bacterium]|nr:phosphoribosylglycinamide formyltransferase [Sphingobacteriaceae bacterium]
MIKIALFASGSGSNVENIYHYFKGHPQVKVAMVVCNKPDAYVTTRARNLRIPLTLVSKRSLEDTGSLLYILQQEGIDFIALAGFLWLVPTEITAAYAGKIVNIHPALLPKHGGKGMYGARVHAAVLAAKEKESGITIHHVNEAYDEGAVIAQFSCPVYPIDTADSLGQRVHALEYEHYPRVIESLCTAL